MINLNVWSLSVVDAEYARMGNQKEGIFNDEIKQLEIRVRALKTFIKP